MPKKLFFFELFSIKQETLALFKAIFLYFGYESKCAQFEYTGRSLNIKLFAVVVYFCLVDCYSCMISKMLETERIKKTKILCTSA